MENNRIAQLLAMLAESPEDSFLLYALALEYVKNAQIEAALAAFEALAGAHPTYLARHYHHGKTLADAGQIAEAARVLQAGMVLAKKQGNAKTLAELIFLYEDVTGEDLEDG